MMTIWITLLFLKISLSSALAPIEIDTPPLKTLYKWKQIDYDFPDENEKQRMLDKGDFIPENVIPLGIERWAHRIFVTMPKWKKGVPASLASIPVESGEVSPVMSPYPDWTSHNKSEGDCSGMTSIFRMSIDPCGRMWVLDSGQIEAFVDPKQICPAKLFIIDLNKDEILGSFDIPKALIPEDSLYSNIVTDTRTSDCSDTHAYMADTRRFGLLVFRLRDLAFWRVSHFSFLPEPLAANYSLHGVNFDWQDGIFSLSLSPFVNRLDDRLIYFHAMSSFKEFMVPSSVVRNPKKAKDNLLDFKYLGSRGIGGQVSAAAIDRNGVMFFNLISKDAIGCWDSRKPYKRDNLHVISQNSETLIFPNDLRIDNEKSQLVWILSNQLTKFQFAPLNSKTFNYRIFYLDPKEAVTGSICDPKVPESAARLETDFFTCECY